MVEADGLNDITNAQHIICFYQHHRVVDIVIFGIKFIVKMATVPQKVDQRFILSIKQKYGFYLYQ